MQSKETKCTKLVDGQKRCERCHGNCVKNGISSGRQRYRCKSCGKSFLSSYKYQAYQYTIRLSVLAHLKEGCSIRSIARLLKISTTTVIRIILRTANRIKKPVINLGKEYELDEMCTYVKCKTRKRWIVYAIRKDTKEIIDFTVGRRINETLKRVTDTLVLSNASKVCTDKLPNYRWLLPEAIHCTRRNGTNYIERKNLTLRTHLKRLSRRTICFSKSVAMLIACLRIYFWG